MASRLEAVPRAVLAVVAEFIPLPFLSALANCNRHLRNESLHIVRLVLRRYRPAIVANPWFLRYAVAMRMTGICIVYPFPPVSIRNSIQSWIDKLAMQYAQESTLFDSYLMGSASLSTSPGMARAEVVIQHSSPRRLPATIAILTAYYLSPFADDLDHMVKAVAGDLFLTTKHGIVKNRRRALDALLHLLRAMSYIPGLKLESDFLLKVSPFMTTPCLLADFVKVPCVREALSEAGFSHCDVPIVSSAHPVIAGLYHQCARHDTAAIDNFHNCVPLLAELFALPESEVVAIAAHVPRIEPHIDGSLNDGHPDGWQRTELLFAASSFICLFTIAIGNHWALPIIWVYHLGWLACGLQGPKLQALISYVYLVVRACVSLALLVSLLIAGSALGTVVFGVDIVFTTALLTEGTRRMWRFCRPR
ncbi:F-box domain-containing protein [Plasmodiophora brassicae]|uniref:Uncharacterized protein n=1 Tax=Plasmodiophora brassicae TaxID=37360 RepID=A0A3P3Y969_PLABS|nr:unnamed protein product [Plasmodiophora brassicae]